MEGIDRAGFLPRDAVGTNYMKSIYWQQFTDGGNLAPELWLCSARGGLKLLLRVSESSNLNHNVKVSSAGTVTTKPPAVEYISEKWPRDVHCSDLWRLYLRVDTRLPTASAKLPVIIEVISTCAAHWSR